MRSFTWIIVQSDPRTAGTAYITTQMTDTLFIVPFSALLFVGMIPTHSEPP